jgi:putative transcriptional regulator
MGEVQDKSWIIVSNEGNDVLNYQVQNIWSDLIKSLGGDYPLWAQAPKNPDWN